MTYEDALYQAARRVVQRAAYSFLFVQGGGIVDADDLTQDALLWMYCYAPGVIHQQSWGLVRYLAFQCFARTAHRERRRKILVVPYCSVGGLWPGTGPDWRHAEAASRIRLEALCLSLDPAAPLLARRMLRVLRGSESYFRWAESRCRIRLPTRYSLACSLGVRGQRRAWRQAVNWIVERFSR
jgi:hypothetical protein